MFKRRGNRDKDEKYELWKSVVANGVWVGGELKLELKPS